MFTNIGFLRKSGGSRFDKPGNASKSSLTQSPKQTFRGGDSLITESLSKAIKGNHPFSTSFKSSLGDSPPIRGDFRLSKDVPKYYFGSTENQRGQLPNSYSSVNPTLRRPPVLNLHKTNCIFNIYMTDGSGASKRFAGMGFLASASLAVTTNMIFPSEIHASRSVASFLDAPNVFYRFDPQKFFFTHKDLRFSIVAVIRGDVMEQKLPLPLHQHFTLRENDPIVFYYNRVETKNVLLLEGDMFCYTAGQELPQGLPVFDYAWELQGIHHTSTSSYRINQATRVDSIFSFLLTVRHMLSHPELDMMLESEPYEVMQHARLPVPVDKRSIFVYWFEWYTRNVYKYDVILDRWNRMVPHNMRELDGQGVWYFNWNCRLCYLHNGNVAIVGGISDSRGTIKSDALIYRPSDNTVHKLPNMLEAREACAIVATEKWLYATGGRYPMSTCEVFAFEGFHWSAIAPMTHGRYDHCAAILPGDHFVYVSGGMPAEVVGRSMERYDINRDCWELITIALPEAFVHHALVPLTHKRVAVMGGKFTKRVFVLEISQTQIDSHYVPRYHLPESDIYRLMEAPGCPEMMETVFPPILDENSDQIVLMTGRDGYAHLHSMTYSLRSFGNLYNPPSINRMRVSRSDYVQQQAPATPPDLG